MRIAPARAQRAIPRPARVRRAKRRGGAVINWESGCDEYAVCVGLWNGAATVRKNRLLYRLILDHAASSGASGSTVVRGIEGGRARGAFRSVESEVASNELPMWLEFVDGERAQFSWMQPLLAEMRAHAVIVRKQVRSFGHQAEERVRMRARVSRGVMGKAPGEDEYRLPLQPGLSVQLFALEGSKTDRAHGSKLVHQAVAELLRRHAVSWVFTARGVFGFGEHRQMRRPGLLRSAQTPIMMTVVDDREKLAPLLPELADLIGKEGLMTVSEIEWYCP